METLTSVRVPHQKLCILFTFSLLFAALECFGPWHCRRYSYSASGSLPFAARVEFGQTAQERPFKRADDFSLLLNKRDAEFAH